MDLDAGGWQRDEGMDMARNDNEVGAHIVWMSWVGAFAVDRKVSLVGYAEEGSGQHSGDKRRSDQQIESYRRCRIWSLQGSMGWLAIQGLHFVYGSYSRGCLCITFPRQSRGRCFVCSCFIALTRSSGGRWFLFNSGQLFLGHVGYCWCLFPTTGICLCWKIQQNVAGFSPELYNTRTRKMALCDYLTRTFGSVVRRAGADVRTQGGGWSGEKGGEMSVDQPGQYVRTDPQTNLFVRLVCVQTTVQYDQSLLLDRYPSECPESTRFMLICFHYRLWNGVQ